MPDLMWKRVYMCLECAATRYWGNGGVVGDYKPLLGCAGCGKPTRHMDSGLAEERAWEEFVRERAI